MSESQNVSEESRNPSFWDKLLDRFTHGLAGMFFERQLGAISFCMLVACIFLISYQLVPGQEWFVLEIPQVGYFVVIGVLGGFLGLIGSERRGLGAMAGAMCAVVALVLVALLMDWLSQIPLVRLRAAIRAAVVLIGFLPGVVFYAIMESIYFREDTSELDSGKE